MEYGQPHASASSRVGDASLALRVIGGRQAACGYMVGDRLTALFLRSEDQAIRAEQYCEAGSGSDASQVIGKRFGASQPFIA